MEVESGLIAQSFARKTFARSLRFIRSRLASSVSKIRPYLIYDLEYGSGTTIGAFVRLKIVDGGSCALGMGVTIENNADIVASGGKIHVGANVFIGRGTTIVAIEEIRIGKNTMIAENVTIRDQNHIVGFGQPLRESGLIARPINIGENVWIGANCCVLKGVSIGSNSVIGAGSVVTKSLPDNVICAGTPARIIRTF